MKRYQIWNKKTNIYTPSGEEFTPEEWMDRYKWIKNPAAIPVISHGMLNGSFIGELSQMKEMYEAEGAVFGDESGEELLRAFEKFEDDMNMKFANNVTAEERIAAALEAQVMMSLPDTTV